MNSKNLASSFKKFIPSVKEEVASSKCRQHPEFDLDTICFHHLCRQQHNQVICYCCGTEAQPHMSHTQQLHPIYKTSPAFRLVDFASNHTLQSALAKEQQNLRESTRILQENITEVIQEITDRAERRMECLKGFLEKNGIFKICSRIRHHGDDHADCCISVLNTLKDLQERGQASLQNAQNVVQWQLSKHSELLKSQIQFIRLQFQNIINRAFSINFGIPLTSQPSHHNRMDAARNVTVSEIIPVEQAFQNINVLVPVEDSSREEGIISVEQSYLKQSQSMLLDNSMRHQNQKLKHKKIKKLNHNKSHLKPEKLVRQANEENRSSPIVLDEDECGQQLQNYSQESFINQLNISLSNHNTASIIQSSSPVQIPPNQVGLWEKGIKQPAGTESKGNDAMVIWNADKLDDIITFLSAANFVQHLVIQDKKMATEEQLLRIICQMPWLQGLHLHCESQVTSQVLEKLNTAYFSYLPSYRFIQVLDLSKFFSRGDRAILEKLPPCLEKNVIPHFRNVFIQQKIVSIIEPKTEEVSFVQDESDLFRVIDVETEQSLLNTDKLLVLVFSNILIRKNVNLKAVYERNRCLHTLVFDDCEANHSELVNQMQYLRSNQLVHFQLTGDNLDRKIILGQQEADQIFRHAFLQTLIITHVQFTSNRKIRESSLVLRKIYNLSHLVHLNLFGSEPVYNDLLTFIHRSCRQSLKVLNIGCSEVNASVVPSLEMFTQLEALGVDYTEIGEDQLLKSTRKMPDLVKLSVESLCGGPILYEEGNLNGLKKKYGQLTPKFFKKLKYKNLRYVNIYNCQSLSNYGWEDLPQLECLRVSKDLLAADMISKLQQKGIKIFIDSDEEFTVLQQNRKKPSHSSQNRGFQSKENTKAVLKSNQNRLVEGGVKLSVQAVGADVQLAREDPPKSPKTRYQLKNSQINARKMSQPSSKMVGKPF